RNLLPAPESDAYLKRAYEAPTGEIEIVVAGMWQELLHLDQIGRHDHFFELGGHSLLAVQLVARLRQILGVDVNLRDLFTAPTLAALAKHVAAATALVLPPIQPADRTQNLPLSWAQQRLWFLAQLDPAASAAYHMPAAFELQGSLDRTALQAALDRIVARHEILRSTIVKRDDGTRHRLVRRPVVGFLFSHHALTRFALCERRTTVALLREDEIQCPFDFENGPLLRGRLLQLADDHHIFLFSQHHIISDGWSIGILIREIGALYSAFKQALPDPLPTPGIQYADYALWQRQYLQGQALQAQIDFWRNHLAGAPALLELPIDHPRPAMQSFAGASIPLVLAADLTAGLRASSQRHGTTPFMTLLAGWSILLARLSGQSDLVIGTPVANRQRTEIESAIGFFINTLALRIRLDGDPTVAQLLERVKTSTLAAYAHQDVPFEQVVEALQPVRTLSHSPLFQVLLTLNNTPESGSLTLPGLELTPLPSIRPMTHFDLTLALTDSGAAIAGDLHYLSGLFEQATIERIAEYFQTLLRAMIVNDSQHVSALPLLTATERQRLLVEWNATQVPYTEQLIHQLFEAHATAQPSVTALVYQDQSLSYSELNGKANQLAHHLISLGIRPDDRVALCVERSPDMVVGLLGILKAGGAYVPLDPGYPDERLAFMLTDCAPVALLTQTALKDRLQVQKMPVVTLDDDSAIAQESSDNPDSRALGLTPAHLAYIIYTSGSTGRPKGVMNVHRGLTNLASAQIELFDVGPGSQVLQFASFSFDASIWEIVMALCSGACLHLASREALQPGEPLVTTLQQNAITHVTLPPTVLATLPAEASFTPMTLVVAGEACPAALAQQWA